jgi:hypothetical protein
MATLFPRNRIGGDSPSLKIALLYGFEYTFVTEITQSGGI